MIEFKTSFIPKKPIVSVDRREKIKRGKGAGLLGFISFIIFLLFLVAAGGLFLYKVFLENNIEAMSGSLDRVRQAIEPESIRELVEVDSRIGTAQGLLDSHQIISPLFRLLEKNTLKTVRFNGFEYIISEEKEIQLSLLGEARDYLSLALQSDIFSDLEALEEPIFSDLNLNERGNVSFRITTFINKSFILYKNNIGDNASDFKEDIKVLPTAQEILGEENVTEEDLLLQELESININEDVEIGQ